MSYYGCGNHGCVLGSPPGRGTNGPCHCLEGLDPETRVRVRDGVAALRVRVAELEGERDALRRVVRERDALREVVREQASALSLTADVLHLSGQYGAEVPIRNAARALRAAVLGEEE